MHVKWLGFSGLLVMALLVASVVAQAQPDEPRFGRGGPRGGIIVTNDWQDEVPLSLWSNNRERIGEWIIRPGDTVVLQEGGSRIRVRQNYKIKVGDDWGWVNLGRVGRFQQGTWYVNVRDIWRATHRQRGGRQDWRSSEAPDWRR